MASFARTWPGAKRGRKITAPSKPRRRWWRLQDDCGQQSARWSSPTDCGTQCEPGDPFLGEILWWNHRAVRLQLRGARREYHGVDRPERLWQDDPLQLRDGLLSAGGQSVVWTAEAPGASGGADGRAQAAHARRTSRWAQSGDDRPADRLYSRA